jgi:hypothetical protein
MSIRLKRLSLKDVHMVSTDGYVSDVKDVTKDVSSHGVNRWIYLRCKRCNKRKQLSPLKMKCWLYPTGRSSSLLALLSAVL